MMVDVKTGRVVMESANKSLDQGELEYLNGFNHFFTHISLTTPILMEANTDTNKHTLLNIHTHTHTYE